MPFVVKGRYLFQQSAQSSGHKKRAAKKLAAQYLLLTKINMLDQFNVNGIHTFFTFLQVKFYTIAFFDVID